MHRSHNQTGGWNIPLSALGGGEGRGEVGGPQSRTAELPTSPSRRSHAGPLPLPPQAGGEGVFGRFLPVTRCSNAVHHEPGSEGVSRFFGADSAIFSSRSRSIICVRMGEVGRRYGWSGGRLRGLPALPAPSLRASISLPAKTAGPLRFLLVKLLMGNGLWRCARRFLGCVLDFSPCSQGGSSLSLDRSRGASGPRAGRFPGSPRGLPSA